MAKKDDEAAAKKLDEQRYQAAIEEKVRLMLDTEVEDKSTEPVKAEADPAPSTAPVLDAEESGTISPEGPAAAAEAVEVTAAETEPETEAKTDEESEETPDPETDKAVDDIVAKESDELLKAEDDKLAKAFDNKKPSLLNRFKEAWSAWWSNPLKRRATLAGGAILLLLLFVVPTSRYFILNTAGVRSSASLQILDDSTQQPLKNVEVRLGNQSGRTDKDGRVSLSRLKLGRNVLHIEKRAFAKLERTLTLGWGSNPLGDFKITPVGSQYSFVLSDYLSGKPVANTEAVSDDANAQSDDEGNLKLTLDVADDAVDAEVTIKADGYREEKLTLDLSNKEAVELELVPAHKHVFISKRSGRYDVYKIDADGKNEEKVLSGSGTERDDLVLVTHPGNNFAALVSTRENVRNKDGFLLSTLTLISLDDNTPSKVAQSERIQIVDWIGDRLVYVQIAEGASAGNPKRHRLMSYDTNSGQSKELAAANYFNDVLAVGNNIFYAPSTAYSNDKPGFYKVNTDGNAKQTVFGSEVWNVFRVDYDKLVLAVAQEWYEFKISDSKATKLNGEPANLKSRIYIDSPDHTRSLWVDNRDGKGVLLSYDLNTKEDTTLQQKSGLSTPVLWLSNNAVVFRVTTGQETADYVMSTDGGDPKKLKDVTNTSGIERWYYY